MSTMPGSGRTTPVAPSGLRVLFGRVASGHRMRLALTYGLTVIENLCDVLYPFVIGLAIDGLLAGRWVTMVPLIGVWLFHLGVGLVRHVYDTIVFTRVYADIASGTVERQRDAGVDGAQIAARVTLSQELVDFLQTELPTFIRTLCRIVGSLAMLFAYDTAIAVASVASLLPVVAINSWFGRRAVRLNRGLNDRLERQVGLVTTGPLGTVRRHFEHLRFWRIRVSNAEAATWGVQEVVIIALTAFALFALTGSPGVTAGVIYAVLAYIFDLRECVETLPTTLQNLVRVRDIADRLVEEPG